LLQTRDHTNKGCPHYSDAFSGDKYKTCQAELRFSAKLAREPQGQLIISAELDAATVKWSKLTRGLSYVVLQLIGRMIGPDFTYSTGDPLRGVRPHVSFPLFKFVDFVDITSEPVSISRAINETDEEIKERLINTSLFESRLKANTTISFQTRIHYVDFSAWCASDLPYIHRMKLSRWWGNAPLRFSIWEKGEDGGRKDVCSLQLNNPAYTKLRSER